MVWTLPFLCCVLAPRVVPQTRGVALQTIGDLNALADWKMSAPTYLYERMLGKPGMHCNILDMRNYTTDRLDYEVPPTVDDQTANKQIENLDKRVVHYLRKAGWMRISTEGRAGGIPRTRCYAVKEAMVEIFKTTGRCTMNTPCRVFDGFAVIVYGLRRAVRNR